MDLSDRIKAFAMLGDLLRDSLEGKTTIYSPELKLLIENQEKKNPWFTPGNVKMAVNAIAGVLTSDNLRRWTEAYPELKQDRKPGKIAVIMAGNIPLAGFHDFMTVLISGHSILAKTSSKDDDLIRFIAMVLIEQDSRFRDKILFTDKLSEFDGVIATGSDNSSRYFEYYFGKHPHIIRKNRNSIAVIDGDETENELKALGADIFTYFGLGCRNISKVFIPRGYNLTMVIKCWDEFSGLVNHRKYANNYDFNKAVFLVNREKFTDTGFLLIRENPAISSPVSVLNYEEYDTADTISTFFDEHKEKIQCITGRNFIPFGSAQLPALWEYADKIDTMDFLLKKIRVRIL